VLVEEREGDEIQVEVARRFAMIARENAEAAGVVREGFMEAKLCGEIRNRAFRRGLSLRALP
jgi:hypothetical protein